MRVALGLPGLIDYEQGGGIWLWALQYALALKQADCDVLCITVAAASGNAPADEGRANRFIARVREYCPGIECCVVLHAKDSSPDLSTSHAYGLSVPEFEQWAQRSDALWNLAAGIRKPLLDLFPRRVLVDGDPGHLQVSGLQCDLEIGEHQCFLTVGLNVGAASCEVPLHGQVWRTFPQMLFLDLWKPVPDPGLCAPFSSITHWTWEELYWNDRWLSCSKRQAYLDILRLPIESRRPMTLAASLDDPQDKTGDKKLFESHGWNVLDSWQISGTPADYVDFIARSRAEICAPKPIYVDLKTGWISERSAAYLATGRPVLMKDTGIDGHLPTGLGLLTFTSLEEAAAKVKEIDADYARHSKHARMLAEDVFDSRKIVPGILEWCK